MYRPQRSVPLQNAHRHKLYILFGGATKLIIRALTNRASGGRQARGDKFAYQSPPI